MTLLSVRDLSKAFGGVKANPLWATPLMPVIFLLSACVNQ